MATSMPGGSARSRLKKANDCAVFALITGGKDIILSFSTVPGQSLSNNYG